MFTKKTKGSEKESQNGLLLVIPEGGWSLFYLFINLIYLGTTIFKHVYIYLINHVSAEDLLPCQTTQFQNTLRHDRRISNTILLFLNYIIFYTEILISLIYFEYIYFVLTLLTCFIILN